MFHRILAENSNLRESEKSVVKIFSMGMRAMGLVKFLVQGSVLLGLGATEGFNGFHLKR